MNLATLKKSRRAPKVGDVFTLRPPGEHYLYGRVIDTDANPLGVGGAILIYIYRARSSEKSTIPPLLPSELLVPPIMTNRLPWSRAGFFELVEHQPLQPTDRLPRHCFRDSRGWFFDEKGIRLAGPVEPVGQWGLHSYLTIDDEVSAALELPLARPGT